MPIDTADALATAYFAASFAFAAYLVRALAMIRDDIRDLEASVEILKARKRASPPRVAPKERSRAV